jgi:hypothetical protein
LKYVNIKGRKQREDRQRRAGDRRRIIPNKQQQHFNQEGSSVTLRGQNIPMGPRHDQSDFDCCSLHHLCGEDLPDVPI